MKKLGLFVVAATLLSGIYSSTLFADDANGGTERRVRSMTYTSDYDTAIGQIQRKEFKDAFPTMLQYARYGEKYAQYLVGLLMITGDNTPLNVEEGLVWMRLSLEQKTTEWESRYAEITANLSKAQLDSLEPMYQKYKQKYGADAQNIHCGYEKRRGSNMRVHACRKNLLAQEFYTVVEYAEDK